MPLNNFIDCNFYEIYSEVIPTDLNFVFAVAKMNPELLEEPFYKRKDFFNIWVPVDETECQRLDIRWLNSK